MLYCPKCQQTYEDAVQRFCLNDGGRLLAAPTSRKTSKQPTVGVFTNVLKRKPNAETDKFAAAPGFSKIERSRFLQSNNQLPITFNETVESDLFFEPLTETFSPEEKIIEPAAKPAMPAETSAEAVQSDDEQPNANENTALTWDNPQALIGQTIKGRYRVIEQIGEDEDNFTYLAEDKILSNKKVVVRVLTDDDAGDTFSNKIFDEEKVALTHFNHPNIANVIDSGALPEGNPFILSEFVEGVSVKDHLRKPNQFDVWRAAKIIRQVSYALDEAHQNGVLHRNINPACIILSVNASGAETVKLIDFGTPKGGLNEENLPYKSPEQIAGKRAGFVSDEFSLAVVAYQMLTDRLPFDETKVGSLLKAQREGLRIQPTDIKHGLPPSVNEILQRAAAFNPSDRFQRVRGFGDAFFNALTDSEVLESKKAAEIENLKEPLNPAQFFDNSDLKTNRETITFDLIPEAAAPDSPNEFAAKNTLFAMLGAAIILLGLWGIWTYLSNRANQTDAAAQTSAENIADASRPTAENSPLGNVNNASPAEIETPPPARSIVQPPNTNYFQNEKENFKADAMNNFLGFSLYYPKDWKLKSIAEVGGDSKTRSNFIDISKDAPSGTPIEQLMVSYYHSNGTYNADTDIFAGQVAETNDTLKKILPNYQMISEGAATLNNGWRGYEIKFQGTGKTANGENIVLWGKRTFIPAATREVKNGYVITILATSLSDQIKDIDDVGSKGELPNILATFEPNRNF